MDRTSIRNTTSQQQQEQWTRSVSSQNAAMANEYFEQFVNASSLKHILGYYRGIMDNLHLRPTVLTQFYPKLRANLTSWRAKAVWKKFDSRASHKCYGKGRAVPNTRVLIIGAGPCGLRTAIEAQLLGAKVVVIEKRDRFSRNNVLHLWPFVIEDLRMLGAKKFHGKFCAGAIDHISIRQLQCILLKVALLLGVEVHTEVSFEKLIEPQAEEKIGWRAELQPSDHPVSQYEFDVIIGADGKRNTLQGFSRKEFRGKLAIAITANFINKKTEAEARVEEISGVAFIFNQKFFKELHETTRIDLENIVYYKDDTHYFVMTAKKASLLEKGVIKQDLADTEKLLAPDNVDRDALQRYAIEAANFSTNYQLPDLEFAVNHYGQPDIAMFDFTSMYAAENASKVLDRNGHKLLMILVGDSLLEPFWPTGSGCARGFLSSLDAAWAIRGWGSSNRTPLDVLAERESVYRLLAQTTPDNLNKDWKSYTLDPATRYPNLNRIAVTARQVACLYDTDDPTSLERMLKRNAVDKAPNESLSKKRRRGTVDNDVLLTWLSKQLKGHEEIQLTSFASIFKDGNVLCAIIHHYRPDLLDYNTITDEEPSLKNQLAFDVLEKELGIPPVMTGIESISTEDYLTIATYLTEIYDTFRGEIPHIKHPKLELPESTKMTAKLSELTSKTLKSSNIHPITSGHQVTRPSSRHKRHIDASAGPVPGSTVTALPPPSKQGSIDRKSRKRKTLERMGASVHHDKAASQTTRTAGTDEDLVARIKSLEDKWRDPQPVEKKPKDLLRAIGKIETSDWNIKEIEKKIMENKLGKPSKAMDKEKVPKWSKEQFLARQNKMERQHYNRQDSSDAKFADIDKCIQKLDQKLKEGTTRDLGTKKVASIKENLVSKVPTDSKRPEKSPNRTPVLLPTQSASEFCHFCGKRVYLMERLSAEGRFFHHGCFKCQYCHTQLRLGSYAFDRDGMYGYKFFCVHHFGMEGELPKVTRKPSLRLNVHAAKSPPDKGALPGIGSVDLLDRVQTPERAEFSNLSTGNASSKEESLSQMDEDEWTDRNFGASCAELGDSDDESSSESDSDIDDDDEEDAYDDAVEDPETKEGAMKWTERWKHSYKGDSDSDEYSSSDGSSYYENSSDDEESDTATEGEDEIRARELRRQEVQVEPPVVHTDTGTDTEIVSDESSSESSSEVQNSATEISTDSEFAQDEPTPTKEVLAIALNDFHVTKTRGSGNNSVPRKIQVTSGYIQRPNDGKGGSKKTNVELKLKPLVSPTLACVKPNKPNHVAVPTQNYALNRAQSTGGMAAKVSLELKKRYLLGEPANNIQKSGSATALDSKFRSFQNNITDCQKLLKPAPEVSGSMQTFCKKIAERKSPTFVTQLSSPPGLFPTSSDKRSAPEEDRSEQKEGKVKENMEDTQKKDEDVKLEMRILEDNEDKEPKRIIEHENVPEGRPRSPLHETSIIVPQINWNKNDGNVSSDSLNSSLSNDEKDRAKVFGSIPTVTVDQVKDSEDMPFDSLCDIRSVRDEKELKRNQKGRNRKEDINVVTTNSDTNAAENCKKSKDVTSKEDVSEDLEGELLDSLCPKKNNNIFEENMKFEYYEAVNKNVSSEKKSLNQPKMLPALVHDIHESMHLKYGRKIGENNEKMGRKLDVEGTVQNSSGISSPESFIDPGTTALTDTELSDWARDEIVSDGVELEDIAASSNITYRNRNQAQIDEKKILADISEIENISKTRSIDSEKLSKDNKKSKTAADEVTNLGLGDEKPERNTYKIAITEAVNRSARVGLVDAVNESLLSVNLENIAFMDTGITESSSDGETDKNYSQGYELLKNDVESDFAEDSLNPTIDIQDKKNEHSESTEKTRDDDTQKNGGTTGYSYVGNVTEDLKDNSQATASSTELKEVEDHNLLTVETETTTEENTCSDSTVKCATELHFDKENQPPADSNQMLTPKVEEGTGKIICDVLKNDNKETDMELNKDAGSPESVSVKRSSLDDKTVKTTEFRKNDNVRGQEQNGRQILRNEKRKPKKDPSKDDSTIHFDEHVQGLKANVEFKNAKDSIDVRKSRRKSRDMATQQNQLTTKPDLLQEGTLPLVDSTTKNKEALVLNLTPDILYRKNVIQKERDVNQKLVHEMVMNKMKTLERKRRSKDRVSVGTTENALLRSKTTTDLFAHRKSNQIDKERPIEASDRTVGVSSDALSKAGKTGNVGNTNRMYNMSSYRGGCSTPDVLLSTNIIPSRLHCSKSTPDVKGVLSAPVEELRSHNDSDQSCPTTSHASRPLSEYSSFSTKQSNKSRDTSIDLVSTVPLINETHQQTAEDAPKAPPRYNRRENINRILEKLKQHVKLREKINDGVHTPERHSWIGENFDKIEVSADRANIRKSKSKEECEKRIAEIVGKRNSLLHSSSIIDGTSGVKSGSKEKCGSSKGIAAVGSASAKINRIRSGNAESVLKVKRSMSFSEISDKNPTDVGNAGKYRIVDIEAGIEAAKAEKRALFTSDPNILEVETSVQKAECDTSSDRKKKKVKDRERRSIREMVTTLFTKKSPSSSSTKRLFSKLSPKSKEISKSFVNLSELRDNAEAECRRIGKKSLSETSIQRNLVTPPPIPPLPKNYHAVRGTDDSSEGELEYKKNSSCDTLDQVGSSTPGSRRSSRARRAARQSQLKRLRLAQEIQRKLEEIEVETKELEMKGVEVEKVLRGEFGESQCDYSDKDETELLKEWFGLMRERQELRRFERELIARAKDLELEDRYSRLQRDVREKLTIENDGQTKSEV